MICPRCGHPSQPNDGCCSACGAAFSGGVVAATVVPFDTTGLPPGATFGVTIGPDGDLMTVGPVAGTDPGTAAVTGTSTGTGTGELGEVAARKTGPLKVGQSLGSRCHIIKLLGVGGMGAAYQACDAELSVAAALKVIRADRQRRVSAKAEKRL